MKKELKELIEKDIEEYNKELDTIEKELKILQIKSKKIEHYPKIMLNIANTVNIPTMPIEITPEEIEKDAEEYGLDIEAVKRAVEIAKKEFKELTIAEKEE